MGRPLGGGGSHGEFVLRRLATRACELALAVDQGFLGLGLRLQACVAPPAQPNTTIIERPVPRDQTLQYRHSKCDGKSQSAAYRVLFRAKVPVAWRKMGHSIRF